MERKIENYIDSQILDRFFEGQLSVWPEVAERYAQLKDIKRKPLEFNDFEVEAQFNPARIRSSAAKTDRASIMQRPCFLCDRNRPDEQQALLWRNYKILVNPFPIANYHFTIVAREHTVQRIADRIADMVDVARRLPQYAIFYNGPRCGASAPDHMHFQAVRSHQLPLYKAIKENTRLPFGAIVLDDDGALPLRVQMALARLPKSPGEAEPKVNLFAFMVDNRLKFIIIPRRAHRPDFYGDAPGQMLVSPASLELAGLMVAARQEDFYSFNIHILSEIYRQLCYTQAELDAMLAEPLKVAVGILTAPEIEIDFLSGFSVTGSRHFTIEDIADQGLYFKGNAESRFTVKNVKIGIGFHWERLEDQQFTGDLEIIADGENVVAVNHVDVERYLASVISSEMSATSSMELLKAHAIISRSWLFNRIFNKSVPQTRPEPADDTTIIRWYSDDAHSLFDVCADDHCQRYQGVTRQTTQSVAQAVDATRGVVLAYKGQLCDARFSKCCGGAMETFENCWENAPKPYLQAIYDTPEAAEAEGLDRNKVAARWISERPDAFCNTTDTKVLSQVLNNYDLETPDFYRWRVEYYIDELSEIVREKSGIDFGRIERLVALRRGRSGRITRLLIVGEKAVRIVGKELEIRRWLSRSHLYSSAFVVTYAEDKIIFSGAGWGHGVGLCQIGAAVMAARGYGYDEILRHYYPDSEVVDAR